MKTTQWPHPKMSVGLYFPSWLVFAFLGFLTGCGLPSSPEQGKATGVVAVLPTASPRSSSCPLTESQWEKPPEDAAVSGSPTHGYYFLNGNRSIWASAWWHGQEGECLRAGEDGIKVGWFRPVGATLEISGHRLDGEAPPLYAEVPCCYPTRFQATGLNFPTEGCWEVTSLAAEEILTFVVWVAP